MSMTARGGQDNDGKFYPNPFVVDGVRHIADCDLLRSRAFPAEHLKCTCGAAERERIACMVERLDNTMMDQAKLAAYIRGQETL